jgi:hypothetical protein
LLPNCLSFPLFKRFFSAPELENDGAEVVENE